MGRGTPLTDCQSITEPVFKYSTLVNSFSHCTKIDSKLFGNYCKTLHILMDNVCYVKIFADAFPLGIVLTQVFFQMSKLPKYLLS